MLLTSCTDDKETDVDDWKKPVKPGKVTQVETTYQDGEFENPVYNKLLKELNLCGPEDEMCPRCATCSPKFFRFFKIGKDKSVEDLFALQIKALTILNGEEYSNPTREVRVYIREGGQLVESNRLKGYIAERITSKSGVDDLIVRFFRIVEGEDHFFNCLFKWSEKDRKYKFVSVERIEGKNWGGPVKQDVKAETSQQVYDELKAEGLIGGVLQ